MMRNHKNSVGGINACAKLCQTDSLSNTRRISMSSLPVHEHCQRLSGRSPNRLVVKPLLLLAGNAESLGESSAKGFCMIGLGWGRRWRRRLFLREHLAPEPPEAFQRLVCGILGVEKARIAKLNEVDVVLLRFLFLLPRLLLREIWKPRQAGRIGRPHCA